jgi:DeoR family transcriptional regulator, aga operon transcriptional repressor
MAAILAAVRRDKILAFLRERASATVTELSGLCEVSEVTIRQDLNQLSEEGLLIRTRGGALHAARSARESSVAGRLAHNADVKQRIGECAARMVNAGDSVLIDASSTGVYVARALAAKRDLRDLTVITNGIYTAIELLGRPDISTILTGGHVLVHSASLSGSLAWDHLGKVMANIGFFGTRGLTLDYGVTELNIHEADVKRKMIERCREVVIVTDSSKFADVSLVTFAEIGSIQRLVTDDAAPADLLDALRLRGVQVVLASA